MLFVEDSPHDAELALLTLERSGLAVEAVLVHDHHGVGTELGRRRFDLILSDFILPGSSGSDALKVARRLAPETPFIFLSGIFGEEHAVEMMRLGAVDYVLKQNLGFLPKAIERALAEVRERRERRRAEDALQAVEVGARLAMDAAGMGMWDYHPGSDRLVWDARCKALFGWEESVDVSMAKLMQACLPEDRPLLWEKIQRALEDEAGEEFACDYRIRVAGELRWIHSRGRSFFENGVCVRFVGIASDNTERKQATESLQRLNDLLGERVELRTRERDRIWEVSRELLAVMRPDMMPVALNPAWEQTLGRPTAELMARSLLPFVHPDDLEATREETRRLSNGHVSTRFVNRLRRADGQYRWLSWTAVPEEGLIYAAVRDITHEREASDALAATNQRLREQIAEREKVEATLRQMQRLEAVGQLTAGVAHDFNNLLTVILTSASFLASDLERGAPLEKSRQRLRNIREAGERGARLTGQLLAFSRRQQLAPEPVNLNDTLVSMLGLLQSSMGGSILIETDTSPDLWQALVDPTQIELIVLNLAINARDAMAVGGTLRLITANEVVHLPPRSPEEPEPGEYVVLAVQDTGTGMSEEVLAKAFEPFFTTKEIGKGSGLGLAQVFGFAKQSGGGASIDTRVGIGTTVKVFLPRVMTAPAATDMPDGTVPDDVAAGAQRTILLVDDDDSVREVTAMVLDDMGYRVIQAASGKAALELIDDSVDLLLADYAMPGMNGGELANIVRASYPQLPIVFVTGYAELGGLDAEEYAIVSKPFKAEDLASRLAAALQAASAPRV
jgi:PAS domain S-box-containing protein